ncbi:MAG: helix-turn-helix transcriptional regulator [Alphaproteobacteria bacterium]
MARIKQAIGNFRARLQKRFRDKEFRDSYVENHTRASVGYQIKAMREARSWSQEELGKQAGGKGQTAIARLENPDYGRPSLTTLLEVASAFDVGLLVRFVPFSELLNWSSKVSPEELNVLSYEDDVRLNATREQISSTETELKSPYSYIIMFDRDVPRSTVVQYTNNQNWRDLSQSNVFDTSSGSNYFMDQTPQEALVARDRFLQ